MTTSPRPTLNALFSRLRHRKSCLLPVIDDPFQWNGVPVEFHPVPSTPPALMQPDDIRHEREAAGPFTQARVAISHGSTQENKPRPFLRSFKSSYLRSNPSLAASRSTPESTPDRERRQSVHIACALPPDYHERPPEYDSLGFQSDNMSQRTPYHQSTHTRRMSEPSPSQIAPFDWDAYFRTIPLERPVISPLAVSDPTSASLTQPFSTFHSRSFSRDLPTMGALQPPTPVSPLNELDRRYLMSRDIDDVLELYDVHRF